jgi:hypothetical protein
MRVDIYLTNLSEKKIAVGMTAIHPGKTEKILQKDFERKASYIDRMIKEGKLSFGKTDMGDISTPAENSEKADDNSSEIGAVVTPEDAGDDTKQEETQTSEADASEETKQEEPIEEEPKQEEPVEEEPKKEETVKEEPEVIEEVPAPKRTHKRK